MKSLRNTDLPSKSWKSWLFAFFLVPLESSQDWHQYNFKNIAPNVISHSSSGLKISVNQSASPLIFVFPKALSPQSLEIDAVFNGDLKIIPPNKSQGFKEHDDFLLRVGIIIEGRDRLNWFQRQLAPSWLADMEKMLPNNKGIDKVYFLTSCRQKKLLNKVRRHVLNTKLVEECVAYIKQNGSFKLKKSWSNSPKILGLWISSDGDDSQSRFEILIEKIKINYK